MSYHEKTTSFNSFLCSHDLEKEVRTKKGNRIKLLKHVPKVSLSLWIGLDRHNIKAPDRIQMFYDVSPDIIHLKSG